MCVYIQVYVCSCMWGLGATTLGTTLQSYLPYFEAESFSGPKLIHWV